MPKRIAATSLNGRTIDILNVIRTNATLAYQNAIPEISDAESIPEVGAALYVNPTLQNEFINALVNRIALVVVNSAVFNNPYRDLKKGYLEYGETVEEVFTQIIEAIPFSAELAPGREFKRSIPDVKTAFHTINWRVLYPITIQKEDLRKAFLTEEGVQSMITSIIDQIYVSASYDEFLLFKYMLIKAVANGHVQPIAFDATKPSDGAVQFRSVSNKLTFMSTAYNEAGVATNTPKERQFIFMDSEYNAKFDVEVLAGAFNMEKADFMGKLKLIDDFTSFDNARFATIRAASGNLEEVTSAELLLMADVKAILVDEKWFQIYDDLAEMNETRVNSGLYWNYFYHTWKIISHSPFANIVAFVDDGATVSAPVSVTFDIASVVESDVSTIVTLVQNDSDTLQNTNMLFVQDQTATAAGIAVVPEGAVIIPASVLEDNGLDYDLKAKIGTVTYTSAHSLSNAANIGSDYPLVVGTTITMSKDA